MIQSIYEINLTIVYFSLVVFNDYFSIQQFRNDVIWIYSAFANSCPLQTDTFLFPLIHNLCRSGHPVTQIGYF